MVEYDFVKTPIVDIVNQIILYASLHRASDIHFDPLEDALIVRMRIDGDLQNHTLVPKIYERNLITRIKLVSAMNITETRLPQDGAIKGRIGGKDLDMRVSILPTNEGEKCVIRILDFQKSLGGLDSLGFSPSNYKKVEKMLAVPNGIILVTGATGSGKSTTTYSMLQALNKEETNLITVEDPIEMNIEGVNQVQTNSEIGMTFAAALRSILRQDPNVILIGEMRDEETAQIAVRASITGHLVLSTIHTNNALATIERLIDMGVQRYMLATSVTGIISQKLARTLCDKCKKKRKTTKYERYMFARVLNKKVKEVYEPVGCEECHNGFKGRIALHEVLYISEHLRDMIADENVDKDTLRQAVYGTEDTTTLLQDALQKVIEGYTTFQEIYRVVDIDVDLDNEVRSNMGEKIDNNEMVEEIDEVDWNNFDGVYDDEIDIIDIGKEDENDLPEPSIEKNVKVSSFRRAFNKNLSPSDPKFVVFFLERSEQMEKEDKENGERKAITTFLDNYVRIATYEEEKLFKEYLKYLSNRETKENPLSEKEMKKLFSIEYNNRLEKDEKYDYDPEMIDVFKEEIIEENKLKAQKHKELLDGVRKKREDTPSDKLIILNENETSIDNVASGVKEIKSKPTIDLSNVTFNYKELMDTIDAYSNSGPTIKDIVKLDLEKEKN